MRLLNSILVGALLAASPQVWAAELEGEYQPILVISRPNFEPPPDDAIVLFDGTDFSEWVDQSGESPKWKIVDEAMEIVPQLKESFGGRRPKMVGTKTKRKFQDFFLHIEFAVAEGDQTNSGVYIQRRYEVQIQDSFDGQKKGNHCGAIYNVKQPDFITCKKQGEWQSFDITFHAARYQETNGEFKKVANARITLYHNNVLIHDDVEIPNKTGHGYKEGPDPGPIHFQDHKSKARFRNIWIKEL